MTDESKKKFWDEANLALNNAGLATYDSSIFANSNLTYKNLIDTPDFQRAAQHVYDMKNGRGAWKKYASQNQMLDENGNLNEKGQQALGKEGVDQIRWFNNNWMSTTKTAGEVLFGKATSEQKLGFLYMMQAYEETSMSWDGAKAFAWQGIVADPTTYASFFTGGAAKAGAEAGKAGLKEGVIAAVKHIAKVEVKNSLKDAFETAAKGTLKEALTSKTVTAAFVRGAVPAIAFSAITNVAEQAIKTRDISFNAQQLYDANGRFIPGALTKPVTIKAYQDGYSLSQFGMATATGAAFGGGIGTVGVFGRKGWDHFSGGKGPLDMIRANLSRVEKAAEDDRKAWHGANPGRPSPGSTLYAGLPVPGGGGGGHTPYSWYNRGLSYTPGNIIPDEKRTLLHEYMRWNPYSIVTRAFYDYNKRPDLRLPVHISRGKYIIPVIDNVDDQVRRIGLIDPIRQAKAALSTIATDLRDGKITSLDASTAAATIVRDLQNSRSAEFSSLITQLDPITNELRRTKAAQPGHMGLETRQIKAMQSWIGHVRDVSNSVGVDLTFSNDYTKRISTLVSTGKEREAVADAIEKAFKPIATIGEGAHMRIAATTPAGRRTYKHEDIKALQRCFEDGYYNPNERAAAVVAEDFSPGKPDNAENFAIRIELFSKNKDRKAGKIDYSVTEVAHLAGLIRKCYDVGREWEALYALRHLLWRSGRGSSDTIPEHIVSVLKADSPSATDLHWNHFVEAVRAVTVNMPHSNYALSQRDVLDRYTQWSYWFRMSRKFPGAEDPSIFKTGKWLTPPFRSEFYENPRNHFVKWAMTYPFGLKLKPSENPDNPTPLIDWAKPKDGAGFFETTKHHTLEVAKTAGRAAIRLPTIPLYPGYAATKMVFKLSAPLIPELSAKGVATVGAVGGGAWLVGMGLDEYTEWKKTGKILRYPGWAAFKAGEFAADLALTPLQMNVGLMGSVLPSVLPKSMESDGYLGTPLKAKHISIDYWVDWAEEKAKEYLTKTPEDKAKSLIKDGQEFLKGITSEAEKKAAEKFKQEVDKAIKEKTGIDPATLTKLREFGQNLQDAIQNVKIAASKGASATDSKSSGEAHETTQEQTDLLDLLKRNKAEKADSNYSNKLSADERKKMNTLWVQEWPALSDADENTLTAEQKEIRQFMIDADNARKAAAEKKTETQTTGQEKKAEEKPELPKKEEPKKEEPKTEFQKKADPVPKTTPAPTPKPKNQLIMEISQVFSDAHDDVNIDSSQLVPQDMLAIIAKMNEFKSNISNVAMTNTGSSGVTPGNRTIKVEA